MMRAISVAMVVLVLSGCAKTPVGAEFNDPYEANNRKIHEKNKEFDRSILRPVAQAYGTGVPAPVRRGVTNFASNLDLPGMVVNDLLQFQLDDAIVNTARFLFNSTIGIAGIFDPADSIGLFARDTDFGETLHVWGAGEGAFLEVPFLGPSTERDLVGTVVDIAMNPVRMIAPSEIRTANAAASVMGVVDTRYEYSDLVDSVLYESADSYAQERLFYLQSRRFELNGERELEYEDPYEDPYAQ